MEYKTQTHTAVSKTKRFAAYSVISGSLMAGCAAIFPPPRYEVVEMPNNGTECPVVGFDFQAYQGQELGFGTARRPLYLIKIHDLNGQQATYDFSMPLAAPTSSSSLSWVVRFDGAHADLTSIARFANSTCTIVNAVRGQIQDAAAESTTVVSPPADGATDSSRVPPDAGREILRVRPTEVSADSSATFAERLSSDLGRAVSNFLSLSGGNGQSEESATLTVERSDDRTFSLAVGSGRFSGQHVTLDRRIELHWDVTDGTLIIPYRIESLSLQSGRLSAQVSLDCSRDMEATGTGLGASGPHGSCAPRRDAQPPNEPAMTVDASTRDAATEPAMTVDASPDATGPAMTVTPPISSEKRASPKPSNSSKTVQPKITSE